jgi:CDP-glucose 4,6-dehydratase
MSETTCQSVLDSLNGTSVLVTGATGLIGSWVTAALALAGARLSLWGQQPFHEQSPVVLLGLNGLRPRAVDIKDYEAVHRAVDSAQPEIVVHLAARTSVRQCLDDPYGAFLVNTVGTLNLIEALRAAKATTRTILSSTHMALTRTDLANVRGFGEDEPPTSGDPYGTSKAASELIARCYHDSVLSPDQRTAVVRFANVFGFGDRQESRVISRFIRNAIDHRRITLTCRSNGRQFLFVTDAVKGLLKLVGRLQQPDLAARTLPVYHFAVEQYGTEGEGFIRMHALARTVGLLTGATVDIQDAPEFAPNEREVQWLSCNRTRQELDWEPTVSLAEGIRLLVEWHRAEALPKPDEHRTRAQLVADAIKQVVPGGAS